MRYTSSHPHAFRNRIAKSIGVLVAAALIATLGLPSAAQAQSISGAGIMFTDGTGFKISWTSLLAMDNIDNWIVTLTKPDDTKVVVNERSTLMSTFGAVTDSHAQDLGPTVGVAVATSGNLTYTATDLGTWWIQVDACLMPLTPLTGAGTCPRASLEEGTSVGYTHGAPAAPTNLAATDVPGGVALTWKDMMTADQGILGYEYAFEMTAAGNPDWVVITEGKGSKVIEADPGEHTFMLRAIGNSDNDLSTTSGMIPGKAESVTVTVPVPTPTLPEIAALFLAMLLLGSGAYLLRRRQSGGLTHA